jgi:hypothetical protein
VTDVRPIVDIRGGDAQGEQIARGIDRRMQLRAFLALGPVIARTLRRFPARNARYGCR